MSHASVARPSDGAHDGAVGARWLIAMLLTSGCDRVYGLTGRTEPVIDGSVTDTEIVDGAPDVIVDAPVCPSNYTAIPGASSRYKILVDPTRDWIYALDDCRNDTPGSGITHLVVFDDTVELDAIRQALPNVASFRVWVGYGRDHDDPPFDFRSVTNVPLASSSNLWDGGEPDNGAGLEPVVWIERVSGLVDARLDDPVDGYVCECDFVPTIGIEFDVVP